jgi:pilus retraction protein PilT
MNLAEHRLPQDGHARLRRGGKEIDLRISVIPTVTGESVVIRLLDTAAGLKSLDKIGFSSHDLAVLRGIMARSNGMFLVTGPTGSGKSTTLYSVLNEMKQRGPHVITVEDPVEYQIDGVEQIQVASHRGYTFAMALRQILRHDPDVVMIGEIRDLETLDVALKAAGTGHLVFSTLHTTDATLTINRILSFYPPHQQNEVRFALANALTAIVSLRLVPRSDEPGRVPACEVLVNTAAVRDQIRDLSSTLNIPDLIREGSVAYGMQSFDQSLMTWYSKGVISYENATFYATNPAEFALRVQGVDAAADQTFEGFRPGSNA